MIDCSLQLEVTDKIVTHLRRVRPQVVVTFDPNGSYGHPDQIAICQFTTATVDQAKGAIISLVNGGRQVERDLFAGWRPLIE